MKDNRANVSGLAVLLITGEDIFPDDLFQQLCQNGCAVEQITLEEMVRHTLPRNFCDLILFEIGQLTATALQLWGRLKTDPAFRNTPAIVVVPQKYIATIRSTLAARPLVYFVQRDRTVQEKIIGQINYVSYLQGRYN